MTYEEKLKDIKEHPEKHRHDLNGLTRCCMIDGCLYPALMDAHEMRENGGRRCDVVKGPCNCGAWH